MALTDCNLPNREGRSAHAGKDHGDKEGEREVNVQEESCRHMGNV